MALTLRDIEVFKPYCDEFPYDLFAGLGLADEDYERCVAADYVRVAKLAGKVIGAYSLHADTRQQFTLLAVVIAPEYRRQGLGRWLVGHAVGISESKGSRAVYLPYDAAPDFFKHFGFVSDGDGQRYDLIPEG